METITDREKATHTETEGPIQASKLFPAEGVEPLQKSWDAVVDAKNGGAEEAEIAERMRRLCDLIADNSAYIAIITRRKLPI